MSRPRKSSSKPQSQRRGPRGDAGEEEIGGAERLQKVLAAAGVASRRDCEELIREGRVEIDRQVVTELGTKVDPVAHEIRVDGEALRRPKRVYFALNKPPEVVCTNFDPSGRTRVIDLVPNDERVFAVGRLDRASEGLILVTNDGAFANHITHPRYGVEKKYLVRVAGRPGPAELAKLRRGVHLAEGFCQVESVSIKSRHKQSSDLLIVLDEGRNREIRRILAKVGHKVVRLKRIEIGNLKLGPLEAGEWRKLAQAEVDGLMAITRKKRKAKKTPPPREAEEPAAEKPVREKPLLVERPASLTAKPKPAKKAPKASEIAARMLAGKDFEDADDDEDFEEELLSDEVDTDDELSDDGDDEWGAASFGDDDEDEDDEDEDDEDEDDEDEDDDDGEIHARVIREEVKDTTPPPRSGPAPRGEVIDFDEDSPPPLQPKKVREPRGVTKSVRPRREGKEPREGRVQRERPVAEARPLKSEPRTGHRRSGDEQRPGQMTRRGQRHRQADERNQQRTGRAVPGKPGLPSGRPGRRPRDEAAEGAPLPRRPGKLVTGRPQEDRGARGKYPGKSFGKGKKQEVGGRGPKNIFGKRIGKKKNGRKP